MAHTRETVKRDYPLPAYNFRVTVDGAAMSFAEVSGIAVEYDEVTYRHGLSFVEGEEIATFFYDSFFPVTLKRGTILSSDPLYLHAWLKAKEPRTVEVHLCDETGTPVISWRLAKAVPTKLEAPAFDAGANEVAVETVELKARGVTLARP